MAVEVIRYWEIRTHRCACTASKPAAREFSRDEDSSSCDRPFYAAVCPPFGARPLECRAIGMAAHSLDARVFDPNGHTELLTTSDKGLIFLLTWLDRAPNV